MLETLAPLLPVVGHFEANAVRITEEYRPIVGGIFREVARFADINAGTPECCSRSSDIGHGFNPEAQVMQSGRIGIMVVAAPRWAQNVAEMTVVILDMIVTTDLETALAKAERGKHPVVERFRQNQVGYRQVDMVNSNDFRHTVMVKAFCRLHIKLGFGATCGLGDSC